MNRIKGNIYFPNIFANLLVLVTALGVSVFQNLRIGLILSTTSVFIFFLPRIKFNKLTFSSYFLIALNVYFFIGAFLFNNSSSLYLFKDFVYLILFDLLLKNRLRFSKSIYYITILMSILTIVLNQIYNENMIGAFSPAFGISRILSVSSITLVLFLLFKHLSIFEKIFIFFTTFLTFSAASYFIFFIYIVKKIPVITIFGLLLFILNFNFQDNELFMLIKAQKEKSIENKINDTKVAASNFNEYEIAEVLSVELYQNSGIIFSIIVSIFVLYYIYNISKSYIFTTFSWILISSNPMPLILILIIANLLNISNYENKWYSRPENHRH